MLSKHLQISRKVLAYFIAIMILFSGSMSYLAYNIGFTSAQSSSLTQNTLTGGTIAGAPTYTVYVDSTSYYAKNQWGANSFSGTNAGIVIEQALNATGALGGGIVYVTPGTYPITAMHLGVEGYYYGILMSAPDLKLQGAGKGTILQSTVANSRILTLNYQCVRCEVSDLTVDGQNLNVNPGIPDALIITSNNYDTKITNVFSLNGGTADGMGAFASFRTEFTGDLVSACTHGIALDNSTRCIIDHCQVTDVTGTGYLIQEASFDNKISNSNAYNTAQFNFEISLYRGFSPSRNTISACTGDLAAWSGLSIFGSSQNTIESSHFYGSLQNGIYISGNATAGSANNVISGCYGLNNDGYGLQEDAFGTENIITASNFLLNTGANMTTIVATYVNHCWNGTTFIP